MRSSIVASLALVTLLTATGGCALPHEKVYEAVDASRVGTLSGGYGLAPGNAAPDAEVLDSKGEPVTLSGFAPVAPLSWSSIGVDGVRLAISRFTSCPGSRPSSGSAASR